MPTIAQTILTRRRPSDDSLGALGFLRRISLAADSSPWRLLPARRRPSAGRLVRASDKAGSRLPVVGTGAYTYEATHNWGVLPANPLGRHAWRVFDEQA